MTGLRGSQTGAGATAPAGRPDMPTGFTTAEKTQWNNLCDTLEKNKTLSECDGEVLAQYIMLWSIQQAARKEIKDSKAVLVSDRYEGMKISAATSLVLRLSSQMIALLDRFGLNAQARSRVTPSKQNTKDILEDFAK